MPRLLPLAAAATLLSFVHATRALPTPTNGIDDSQTNDPACFNGGVLSPFATDGQCECLPNFGGKQCLEQDSVNDCISADDSPKCLHSGQCVDHFGHYKCDCSGLEWSGANCETFVNPQLDCLNGGKLTQSQGGLFASDDESCDCPDGYDGLRCEEREDDDQCLSSPCGNGGTCIDLFGVYKCLCTDLYSGKNCETTTVADKDDCAAEDSRLNAVALSEFKENGTVTPKQPVCQHGGTCEDGTKAFACLCKSGYAGAHCEDGSQHTEALRKHREQLRQQKERADAVAAAASRKAVAAAADVNTGAAVQSASLWLVVLVLVAVVGVVGLWRRSVSIAFAAGLSSRVEGYSIGAPRPGRPEVGGTWRESSLVGALKGEGADTIAMFSVQNSIYDQPL
jgi:hypothetical protein